MEATASFRSASNRGVQLGQISGNNNVINVQAATNGEYPGFSRRPGAMGHSPVLFLPFPRNQCFAGRSEELNKLHELLLVDGYCPRVAITGLGGVGKTQIALEFAYRVKESFPDVSIFWIPAVSTNAWEVALVSIAQRLGISYDSTSTNAAAAIFEYLSEEFAGQWLIVVDNADAYEVAFGTHGGQSVSLINRLPHSRKGCILFTTRTRKMAVDLAGSNVVPVGQMSPEIARDFLSKSIIDKEQLHFTASMSLLKDLDYLPLAIMQAVSFINKHAINIPTYLQLLQNVGKSDLSVLSEDFQDRYRYNDIQNPAAVTWHVSFTQLQKEDPNAANLLSFMSCLEPKGIPMAILPNSDKKQSILESLGSLFSYSFIVKREGSNIYDMHRLVHAAAKAWVKENDQTLLWEEEARQQLSTAFNDNNHEYFRQRGQLLPHAQLLLNSRQNLDSTKWFDLCKDVAKALENEGRDKESLQRFIQADKLGAALYTDDNLDTLSVKLWLASFYRDDNQMDRAIELGKYLISATERLWGDSNSDSFKAHMELGDTYIASHQPEQARQVYQRVVDKAKLTQKEDSKDVIAAQKKLAEALIAKGEVGRGIDLLEALCSNEKILKADQLKGYSVQKKLARQYWGHGYVREAVEILERISTGQLRILPQDTPDDVVVKEELARAYLEAGSISKAIALLEHACNVNKAANNRNWSYLQHELARAHLANGRPSRAIELLEELIRIKKVELCKSNLNYLGSQDVLARAYLDVGQVTRAMDLILHVVNVQKDILPADHRYQICSQCILARAYLQDGQSERAIRLLEHVVSLGNKKADLGLPAKRIMKYQLATAYLQVKQADQAMKMFHEVISDQISLGESHYHVLRAQCGLGRAHLMNGNILQAVNLLKRTLKVQKRVLREDHPDIAATQNALSEAQGYVTVLD